MSNELQFPQDAPDDVYKTVRCVECLKLFQVERNATGCYYCSVPCRLAPKERADKRYDELFKDFLTTLP